MRTAPKISPSNVASMAASDALVRATKRKLRWQSLASVVAIACVIAPASCFSTDIPIELTAKPAVDLGDAASNPSLSGPCPTPVGDPGNELGVGQYCVAHAGTCPTSFLCATEYPTPAGASGDITPYCTKLCSIDSDCGTNSWCYAYTATLNVCAPPQCQRSFFEDGGAYWPPHS